MNVVVLCSGGMDSVTALYAAQAEHTLTAILSFDYGAKHNAREIPFAALHAAALGVRHEVIALPFVDRLFASDLLQSGGEIPDGHYEDQSMRQTVVPFRNAIMLSIATGFAESVGAEGLVIAAHGGDHAIYPDCREDFMTAMGAAMRLGTYAGITLLRPFIATDKAGIATAGARLGVDFAQTWSCYKGGPVHCGTCGTCVERREAFALAGVADPTIYVSAPPLPPAALPTLRPRMSSRSPILAQIGHTPLLELHFADEDLTVYAKAEFLNPSGSIKDRLALTIIEDAERRGLINADSIILECTSGNTGIALAMVGAAKGYRVKILMSDTASVERRHLIRHFGAEIELFSSNAGYGTGIALSLEQAAADPRIFLPRQFENPLNALDHEENTGPEILAQIPGGRVDAFISGYGTGGTLTGVGRALKAANAATQITAMEPTEAAMLSGEMPCCHAIEGIAGGYVPPLVRDAPIDHTYKVSSAAALAMTRRLAREFGLLVGTSSGANLCAALATARQLGPKAHVVTILCDRAERYYSTPLFAR